MLLGILLKPLEVTTSPQGGKVIVDEGMNGFQIRVIGYAIAHKYSEIPILNR